MDRFFQVSIFGKLDGLTSAWFESGKLKAQANYKNGKQDGLETWWYENDVKESERTYKNGKQDGLTNNWDESGKVKE